VQAGSLELGSPQQLRCIGLIDVVNRCDSITLQASLTPAFNQLINRELLHTLVRAEIVIPFPTAVEIQRHEG
jgi:hypothetical protein